MFIKPFPETSIAKNTFFPEMSVNQSLSIFFCFVVLIYILGDLNALNISIAPQAIDAVAVIIRRFFALTFWGIFGGLAIWPIYVTGHQIYKLSKTFPIIINARHPDRCGGLKPIGDFFFLMALPFVVLGIGLVLRSIGGLLNNMFLDSPLFSTIREIRTLSANPLLFTVFLPLTVLVFFLPLWSVHQEMANQKMKYEEEYSAEIKRLEEQLRSAIRMENSLEKAKIAKEKIEILQVLNPNTTGFPVWPFRSKRLFTLFSPQILGAVSTILGLFRIIWP